MSISISKRPEPVASGWVVGGCLNFPLRDHRGNADKQQLKHVVLMHSCHILPFRPIL